MSTSWNNLYVAFIYLGYLLLIDMAESQDEWQKMLVRLLRTDVSFSSYDSNFISDLLYKFEKNDELSDEQQMYLEYFVYRYRQQIKDSIVYEQPPEIIEDMLEDDVREQFSEILAECEQSYEVVNNDEN